MMKHEKTPASFLRLKQDLMFRIFFSKNKEVLLSLLRAFLPLPDERDIKDVEILKRGRQKKDEEKSAETAENVKMEDSIIIFAGPIACMKSIL